EEDEGDVEAEGAAEDRGRERVVRAGGARGDQPRRAEGAGMGEDELELARLVAAVGQPRLVVAFDPESGTVGVGHGQGERLDRRRQRAEWRPGQSPCGVGIASKERARLLVTE